MSTQETIVGILLVGAEGCAEANDEPWLRDATPEEKLDFAERVRQQIEAKDGPEAAKKVDPRDWYVDGTGRPYWLKVVVDHSDLPEIARQKAERFTRVVRLAD